MLSIILEIFTSDDLPADSETTEKLFGVRILACYRLTCPLQPLRQRCVMVNMVLNSKFPKTFFSRTLASDKSRYQAEVDGNSEISISGHANRGIRLDVLAISKLPFLYM